MAMPYTHATIDVNRGYRVIGIHRAQSMYRRKQLESGKQEAGNEKVKDVNEGITGRASTPVAVVLRRAETARPILFVSDSGTRWAGKMDDLETFEADFAAPFFEVGRRIIERVAEFDQHV